MKAFDDRLGRGVLVMLFVLVVGVLNGMDLGFGAGGDEVEKGEKERGGGHMRNEAAWSF